MRPPDLKEADVNRIVDEALSRSAIPENVELVTDPGEVPVTMLNADQVHRVFTNIIRNAVQAMSDGGRLGLRTRERDGHAVIEISDTGDGIRRENLSRIFEPSFTTRSRGLGLGLAICDSIVKAHGGTIEAKSELGKGSTFTVRLPIRGGDEG